jgi:pimeloyl-ACP methyl ester carboxylesterase
VNAGKRLQSVPEPMHEWDGHRGVTIAGDSWGDPDGPLVILLHGAGQTRHAWKDTGQRLGASGYYVIIYDARGHGDSDWAEDGLYSLDSRVEDLIAVTKSIGKSKPALIGASMGGVTSLVAVGEHHLDASALVLIDIAPRVEREGVAKIKEFMDQKPEGFDSLEEVAEAIANYQPHRKRPRLLDGLAKNVRLGEDGKFRWHWDPMTRKFRLDPQERLIRLEACARSLTLPTLLVRGGQSDVLSEEGAQDFLRLCPHSEYVNITGAAHMVAGDRNDIFATSVIDFLSRSVPVGNAADQRGGHSS